MSRSTEEIESHLTEGLARFSGRPADEIDLDKPLTAYGLSSRKLVKISGELESWLGFRLAPTIAYEHNSLRKLAAHLAALSAEHAGS